MSQDNVRRAAAQYDRWNGEDYDAWIAAFDPEAEYFSSISAGLDGSGRYVGHAGMRRFVRDYTGDWEYFRIEPIDYIDAGANVVVLMRTLGSGRRSGVEKRAARSPMSGRFAMAWLSGTEVSQVAPTRSRPWGWRSRHARSVNTSPRKVFGVECAGPRRVHAGWQ